MGRSLYELLERFNPNSNWLLGGAHLAPTQICHNGHRVFQPHLSLSSFTAEGGKQDHGWITRLIPKRVGETMIIVHCSTAGLYVLPENYWMPTRWVSHVPSAKCCFVPDLEWILKVKLRFTANYESKEKLRPSRSPRCFPEGLLSFEAWD